MGVFVTGGTGFIGGAVLEALALEPERRPVRALARDRTGGQLVAGRGAQPVMGDVLEPETLRTGMAGCDVVYHVAGMNAFCLRDPAPLFEVNVAGSVNVIEAAAAAGVRRVVYTSSAATLGEARGEVGDEGTVHRGTFLSAYEWSKYEAEQAVLAAAATRGVEVVTVNPCSVQGPGRSTGTARLLVDFLARDWMPIIDTRVAIVDIADCARGHLLAERHGGDGERYVLCGGNAGVREAIGLVRAVAGRGARPVEVPGWLAEVAAGLSGRIAQVRRRDAPICRETVRVLRHGHAYDGSKATRQLGLEYTPLERTLARTVEWLVDFGFVRRPLPNYPRG